MRIIILSLFFVSNLAFGKVNDEITFTIGYHSKESLSLKSYSAKSGGGFAMIKAFDNKARFQKLTKKEYDRKYLLMKKWVTDLGPYKISSQNQCFETIQFKSLDDTKFYCWDHAEPKLKNKFIGFWKAHI